MHLHAIQTLALLAPLSCALRSNGNGKGDGVLTPPHEQPAKRVAIIGAGAAGSSTAYHLTHFSLTSHIPLNITIYDRAPYIGGRTTTVHAWNHASTPIELGGSIFVDANKILVQAARDFNLSTSSSSSAQARRRMLRVGDAGNGGAADDKPDLGIWNGREFVLVTKSEIGWWDKARLLWRYGLAPLRTNRAMRSTVAKFLRMYEEPVFPWSSLSDAVHEVGLLGATGSTGEQWLEEVGVGGGSVFAREIVQASTRVNYASNLGLIHGLETMVCMAANGAKSVDGGNWRIFSHMLNSSTASVRLSTPITSISRNFNEASKASKASSNPTYTLTTPDGSISTYDALILAAPYQFTNITFDGFTPRHVPEAIPYVKLHVTLFASPFELSPGAFGLTGNAKVPTFVLTTLPEGEDRGADPAGQGSPGFFSISVVATSLNPNSTPPNRPEYVYKVFSAQPVTAAFLTRILGRPVPGWVPGEGKDAEGGEDGKGVDRMFEPDADVTWVHQKVWHSYPYEYPRVTFEEIKLDAGVWYTGGIESFISTMETSALMGRNVARLVVDEWLGVGKGREQDEKTDCGGPSEDEEGRAFRGAQGGKGSQERMGVEL